MDGDVDAFLEEVRSSEKLLQEHQDHLRSVTAETEKLQADVASLRKEQQVLTEDSLGNEQELSTICSQTLLQDVRLQKIQNYKTQVKRDLDAAQGDLSNVRGQLEEEINKLCSEASSHLATFGLGGDYLTEVKHVKLDQISKTKNQTEQISLRINDLRKHENVLEHELEKLADTEGEVENKKKCLSQPLQSRARVHDLQQTLCHIGQEQRDGNHLHQLNREISDAEDETTCLRSAVTAMTTELQRLEQLLWFSRMEKMKKRMRVTAKCPGQYHCNATTDFGSRDPSAPAAESSDMAPSKNRPWLGNVDTPAANDAAGDCGVSRGSSEAGGDSTGMTDAEYEDFVPPRDWSASDADGSPRRGADLAEDEARSATSASTTAAAPAAASGAGSAAELAQRRWEAHRARMMARRQLPPPPPPPPPPAAPSTPTAPPLASVRPLRRTPAAPPPAERREWGRAVAPGRLSYRGPQPTKRAPDFRTALQQLREQTAAAAPQKRVRFSTEPPQQQPLDGEEMDDFV